MLFNRNGLHLSGAKQLQATFHNLPNVASNEILVKSLNASGGVYKRAAASKVQTENLVLTGALQKSMVVRVARKRSRDSRMAAIGPRHRTIAIRRAKTGKARMVTVTNKVNKPIGKLKIARAKRSGSNIIVINPGKYGHLVEFGHAMLPHKKQMPSNRGMTRSEWKEAYRFQRLAHKAGAGWVRPHPFIRPAFATATGEAKSAFKKMFVNVLKHKLRNKLLSR